MSGRWQEIAAALRGEIKTGALQSGDRLPSETELAERWQVCRMTAHRVMDELQREGLVVRKRRAGTVVAPPAAVSPTRPSLDSVALLFFHANDFPQADYIQGIRDGLPDETQLLFCDTGNDPLREAQHLERIGSQVSGIVTYPTCAPANTPLYQRLCAAGKPVVCVDRVPAALPVDLVVTDNFGSTRNALQSLVVRGRRRIVFLGYEEEQRDVSSTRERREAYIEALARPRRPAPLDAPAFAHARTRSATYGRRRSGDADGDARLAGDTCTRCSARTILCLQPPWKPATASVCPFPTRSRSSVSATIPR